MTLPQKTALIAGASGLVGSYCLQLLLQSNRYDKVIAVGRKTLPMQHPKLRQLIIDFNKLDTYKHSLIADDIYCTLGTTIKQAGSQENFYKIDYTYIVNLAAITAANFASQFLVVSSLGAKASSPIFYSRVKGQMENAVKPMPFLGVHIFQPSLLLGPRKEKRIGEKVAAVLMNTFGFLLAGPLKKYKAIAAEDVAKAMLYAATQDGAGIKIHNTDIIRKEAALLNL
ncbi:oxidoreductase [Adhaeribacter aerolatus]|uniref:Oxidoreductase n=1 Tax=Adhaeribacter aerolatus TaxID=670289 RepID=A0A512B433_9BACT|nr:NAD-dependent epimerase/dehydratase family protein [Adhaeribacter aerolatus]GEO06715.1 oxidoreductase [Adhaeribacter aerolatus]